MVFPYPYKGRGNKRSLQIDCGTIGFGVIFYVFLENNRKNLVPIHLYTTMFLKMGSELVDFQKSMISIT